MSICLVLSWNTGLDAIWIAAVLSLYTTIGKTVGMSNSRKRPSIHVTSATVDARLLYSTSAELLEIVDCYLDFQESKDSPNLTIYPVMDLLVSGHDPQSASQNACKEPKC